MEPPPNSPLTIQEASHIAERRRGVRWAALGQGRQRPAHARNRRAAHAPVREAVDQRQGPSGCHDHCLALRRRGGNGACAGA
eukprot:scaffold40890_cov66-Phaeocystis_antarctica.AAC.5